MAASHGDGHMFLLPKDLSSDQDYFPGSFVTSNELHVIHAWLKCGTIAGDTSIAVMLVTVVPGETVTVTVEGISYIDTGYKYSESCVWIGLRTTGNFRRRSHWL